MEFTLVSLFLTSIVLMTIVFLLFFCIRAAKVYHDLKENVLRVLLGTAVAGVGSGAILGFFLWCVLPTHYYILAPQSDGYITRYTLDSRFAEEYGRVYIANLTETDYYYCAMAYGKKTLDALEEPFVTLSAGYIVEIKQEVDGWFRAFPMQISSDNDDGEYRWHVLTAEQVNQEYEE